MSREAQTEKRIYTRADAVQNVVDSHGLECLDRLFKGFSDQGSESSLVETFWSRLEEHYRWKPTFPFYGPHYKLSAALQKQLLQMLDIKKASHTTRSFTQHAIWDFARETFARLLE